MNIEVFTFYFSVLVSSFGQEISHCREITGDSERGGQTGQSEHLTLTGKSQKTSVLTSYSKYKWCNRWISFRMSWRRQRGATKTSSAWWAITCAAWTRLWANREKKSTRSSWAARYKTFWDKRVFFFIQFPKKQDNGKEHDCRYRR